MHTFTSNKTIFHYNSDMSGDVVILTPEKIEFRVDGRSILEFVAEYVRGQRIRRIENQEVDELLEIV